ncbi:MAG: hypothetical protein WBS33_16850 [Verrucomicrobiia bacterium]
MKSNFHFPALQAEVVALKCLRAVTAELDALPLVPTTRRKKIEQK